MNVKELISRIRRATGLSFDDQPRALMLELINEAYRDLVIAAEWFRTTQTYTYTEANHPESVFVLDPSVQRIISASFDDRELLAIIDGKYEYEDGLPTSYTQHAGRITLWPHCSQEQEGKILELRVVAAPDDTLDADTDVPTMPDQFEIGLVEYTAAQILRMPKHANPGLSGLADAKYERIKNEFKTWANARVPSATRGDRIRALTLRR